MNDDFVGRNVKGNAAARVILQFEREALSDLITVT